MVDRVKTHMYTEANVKHIVCPDCKGSGSILVIDLMTDYSKRREELDRIAKKHNVIIPYKRKVVNGRYAEVCGRCRGLGWIHKKLSSIEGIEEG